ncbi:SDR family NAD(P)-dependent oxidoreductase [Cryptosporangium sp. NPDC051539]|uniref:SDR family NAD(P)-dependent oxidoreductase n=1 Tax=Cryptosporangium sp. NPDC051539 TaxID=3363962 RepID=UPI00378AF980
MSPEVDFTGQVAVVTGAGGGLGSAFSRELAGRGAAVVVNDLGGSTSGEGSSTGYADRVVREIREAGGTAIANYDTVATEAGGQAVIDAALETFGRIDVVVSNAGNQRNGRFGELGARDINAVHDVHVKGAFFVCQPAYRRMADQGYGRLVLVSSQSGIFGNPFRANYGSAKTALIGLMNVIAQEAPAGVAVNCLFPNAMGGRLGDTPLAERPDALWLVAAGERGRQIAEGMTPDFVTPLAVYLASRACASSQHMYSALGGKYSRLFVGATEGWYVPGTQPPSVEELVAHLSDIDDVSQFEIPFSGLDEMETAIAAKQRLGHGARTRQSAGGGPACSGPAAPASRT